MNVLDHCIVMRILTFYLFSLMVQLLQQGVETDIWLAVAEIDGQQNRYWSNWKQSPDGRTAIICLRKHSKHQSEHTGYICVFFGELSTPVSATVSLFASLTTPESNGDIVWVV